MSFFVEIVEGKNFWDINPELKNIEPYGEMYRRLGKAESGRVMEAIYRVYDRKSKARIAGRNEEDIKGDIEKSFYKGLKWDKHTKIIESYKKDCLSVLEKSLDEWEAQIKERDQYIKDLTYKEDAELKDKMMLRTKTILKEYLEVKAQVEKSEKHKTYHAGTRKSLLERRKPSSKV